VSNLTPPHRRRTTLTYAIGGVIAVLLWYVADRSMYDLAGRGRSAMDTVYAVVLYPAYAAWSCLMRVGRFARADYAVHFLTFYAVCIVWLGVLGSALGAIVGHLLRNTRRR